MRLFVFFLFGIVIAATESFAATYNYKDYWKQSELKTGKTTVQLYVKNSPLTYLRGIANITVSEKNKLPLPKVVEFIKKSTGSKQWNMERLDGLMIYETVDPKSGHLYRLAFNEKSNQFSFGAVKLRYLMPSYAELHLLQVETLTGTKLSKAKAKKSAEWMLQLLIPKLQAADLSEYRGQATAALEAGRALVERTGTNIIGNGLQNGLANTNTAITSSANELSTGMQSSAARLGSDGKEAAADVADSIRGATRTVDKTVSGKNVAKLTAIGATTGVLVSALTTFALSGAWDAAKRAYYEATGELQDGERVGLLEQFENGLRDFRDLAPQAELLEKRLNFLTRLLDARTDQTTEETLAMMEEDRLRRRGSNTEAGFKKCNGDCAEPKLKGLRDNVADIQDGLSPQKASCREVEDLYEAWQSTEANLNRARFAIVENVRVYIGVLPTVTQYTGWQKNRKFNNACNAEAARDKMSALRKKANQQNCDANPNSHHSVCVDYRAQADLIESCGILDGVEAGPGLKAAMQRNAGDLAKKMAGLAVDLSKMDCARRDGDDCHEPGPFEQISLQMKNKFEALAVKCPGSTVMERIKARGGQQVAAARPAAAPLVQHAAPAPAAVAGGAVPSAPAAKTGFWGNLWKNTFGLFKGEAPAVRAASDFKKDALHPYYGGG